MHSDSYSFDDFQAQLKNLIQQQEYQEALDLISGLLGEYPAQKPLLYYWRIALSSMLGEMELAFTHLEAALDDGFWYSEHLLRNSPSLAALQGHETYERLISLNRELEEEEHGQSFPLITLRPQDRCQSGGEPCPLLIALHANASNAQSSVDLWQPAAIAGWLVAIPQSPQAIWKGAFSWDDHLIAEREIKKHLRSLKDTYAIDPTRIILAGHSNGGEAALWLLLTGMIKACGFIAVDPSGPIMGDQERWIALLQDKEFFDLRGAFILSRSLPTEQEENLINLVNLLNQHQIHCQLEVLRDEEPDIVKKYSQAIEKALNFVAI